MLSKTVEWKCLRSRDAARGKAWFILTTVRILGIPVYVHKEEQP